MLSCFETATTLGTFAGAAIAVFTPALKHIHTIEKEAIAFKSRVVIHPGIILLIGIPLAGVLFSFLGFHIEKDWIYVALTCLISTILSLSLFTF